MEKARFEGEYSLSRDMYKDGFEYYQKKMNSAKQIIFMAMFGILTIYSVFLAIRDPKETMNYVIAFVSAAMFFVAWYNPKKTKRIVMECFDEIQGDKYLCQIYENNIKISTLELGGNSAEASDEDIKSAAASGNFGIKPSIIPLDGNMRIFARPEYYILGNKERFHIIPKNGFKSEEIEKIDDFFRRALGGRFYEK